MVKDPLTIAPNASIAELLELTQLNNRVRKRRIEELKMALAKGGGSQEQMEEIGGFDPETGSFKRFDELEENYQYWMGRDEETNERRGNGAALSLRDSVDAVEISKVGI